MQTSIRYGFIIRSRENDTIIHEEFGFKSRSQAQEALDRFVEKNHLTDFYTQAA